MCSFFPQKNYHKCSSEKKNQVQTVGWQAFSHRAQSGCGIIRSSRTYFSPIKASGGTGRNFPVLFIYFWKFNTMVTEGPEPALLQEKLMVAAPASWLLCAPSTTTSGKNIHPGCHPPLPLTALLAKLSVPLHCSMLPEAYSSLCLQQMIQVSFINTKIQYKAIEKQLQEERV